MHAVIIIHHRTKFAIKPAVKTKIRHDIAENVSFKVIRTIEASSALTDKRLNIGS